MSFIEAFNRVRELKDVSYELRGDQLLVEVMEIEAKTKSGIIVSTPSDHMKGNLSEGKPVFCRVLDVGSAVGLDEDGNRAYDAIEPGDIIEVGEHAVQQYSYYPGINDTQGKIGRTREESVIQRFFGEKGREEYESALAGEAKSEMGSQDDS